MNLLQVSAQFKIVIRSFHKQSYYEILKLKPNCTTQEIRNSFIKLSKEYHPDVQGSDKDNSSNKFIKIMEAYRVLSKYDSRALYDLDLEAKRMSRIKTDSMINQYGFPFTTDTSYANNSTSFYGSKRDHKYSNYQIASALIFITFLGAIVQFLTVRNSFTLRRDNLDKQSEKAGIDHALVRANAEKYGNELQIKRIDKKLRYEAKTVDN